MKEKNKDGLFIVILLAMFIPTIIGIGFYSGNKRQEKLDSCCVITSAEIIKKRKHLGKGVTKYTYQFKVEGEKYVGFFSPDKNESFYIGQIIKIRYYCHKPGINERFVN
jgi:hypothetical protein